VNDYFDIKIDRINRPEKVIAGRVFHRRTVLLMHVFLTFAGIFTGLFISYIYKKETYALVFMTVPVLLWYYSTTFKKQILIGNLIISLMTALVPYFVVSLEFTALIRAYGEAIVDTDACSTAWFWTTGFAFFAFINTLVREIIKDMEDEKGDKKEGCRTLPIELGSKNTKILVIALTLFSVVALWALYFVIDQLRNDSVTLLYFLILLTAPFLILAWSILKASNSKDFHRSSQISKIIMLFGILFILVARTFFI
jgi:4-hydroxybenzoate polyprenyltransferase